MTAGLKCFDQQEMGNFARTFENLFTQGDFMGMAAFYSDDALLMAENTPVVQGRQSLERFWEEACKRSGIKERKINVRRVDSSGKIGYVVGAVTLKFHHAVVTLAINYTTVWKLEDNGLWRLVVDISNRQTAS